MSKGFFDSHKHLGAMFDLDRDSKLDAGEFGAMAAFGSMAAREMKRAVRDSDDSPREDGSFDDDDVDPEDGHHKKHGKRKSVDLYVDDFDIGADANDIWEQCPEDTSYEEARKMARNRIIHDRIINALWDGTYKKGAIRDAIDEALLKGVRFSPSEVCELSEVVKDEDQLAELLATADPWFTEAYAPSLGYRWQGAELDILFDDETITVIIDGSEYTYPDPDFQPDSGSEDD